MLEPNAVLLSAEATDELPAAKEDVPDAVVDLPKALE